MTKYTRAFNPTYDSVTEAYGNTLKNCKYYEDNKDYTALLNEVGVLRGIVYCMETIGFQPDMKDFLHFIDIQVYLKGYAKLEAI